MVFKDNFSRQSDIYLKYRPHYPDALYAFLASLCQHHALAWDCGTGNGQAACGLADFFEQVIATDPSAQQIANCLPNKKVIYRVEKAELSSLASDSVDLLTIANALHWFDFNAFYAEARRVLKKGGIIAAWCYVIPKIGPEVDVIVQEFNDRILNDYWVHENRLVEQEYATIPFPFETLESPQFFSQKQFNLLDLIGYLNTWSATQRYVQQHGHNPTEALYQPLNQVWGNANNLKTACWKLTFKIGRNT